MNELLEILIPVVTKVLLLGGAAFAIAMILTPVYTYFAYKYKFWKKQKTVTLDGKKLTVVSKLHAGKIARHIPTMAGCVFVLAIAITTLFFNLSRPQTWLPLAALIGGAAVGLVDDILNLRGRSAVAGLRAPVKFIMITLLGLVLGWFFWYKLGVTAVHVPFIGEWNLDYFIIPLFAFVVVAAGNAVNISDGLDGLAGGLATTAFAMFAVVAILGQNFGLAGFCITIVGALLAYLWFNVYPARFFMGDVGSFALGVSLGVVAMLTDCLFVLPIIGAVFVIETGSVIIQQISKKLRGGKKIWSATPIHHHYEAKGWPETKVTMRFWVLGNIAGIIGIIVALVGGSV
ncbi:MAG: phospho-N-acetylmuramoyl-pentapeptide-transferase [Candidatus Nomurabacteria bacterium]|jgi:phospho-N-acetylmuramoyl-pentapeptide-transferase|nr:phospho-N-acetylmuramoyl-pentapeptide-transferase [Candidatus Nomurabacteria bacterium]